MRPNNMNREKNLREREMMRDVYVGKNQYDLIEFAFHSDLVSFTG